MIKIPVCYSFDTEIFSQFFADEYVPVGCGGYSSDRMKYLDSDGDNISVYNKYINELTLIYWAAKNYQKIGDPDYIGFAHYRRYLDFDKAQLAENRIICSFEDQPFSLYQTYCLYHIKSDLDLFLSKFVSKHQHLANYVQEYFNQRRHAKCNMFIMPKKLFFDYFSFIESCIRIYIDEMLPVLNLDMRDRYQRRAGGFILERMTGFWIYLKQFDMSVNIKDTRIIELSADSIYSRV